MTIANAILSQDIQQHVKQALREDIGSGDITALLIPDTHTITAQVISREPAILCGIAWVNEVFNQLGGLVEVTWLAEEGDLLDADKPFLRLKGQARSILTGERTALNYLQTLSATATTTHHFVKLISGTSLTLLDTRKTIPTLRLAQKYAVGVGGGHNHRIGLYDAFLIKENHIMAAGSIAKAVMMAKAIAPGKAIEIETETLGEVEQAVNAGVDIIMLDNFTYDDMRHAVERYRGCVKFEASGNVNAATLPHIAATGVDFVSIGALTKHVQAIDLSLRVITE